MNNEQCTIFAQTERSSQMHLDDAEVQPKITQKRSGCVMNNVQWRKVKLGEVVVPLKGKLTEQSDCFHDDWKSLINTTAIDGESKTWANPINAVLCEPDDVLMLWDGERSGLVITGKQGVVGSTFARLRPNHELDGKYLYFFLLNNFEWIQNRRTGTGVPHAPKDLMRIFQISYPESLPAQRRIAAILASADKVIAATQKTIAKYKQIRQGMMEDLLKPKEGWKMVKLGECLKQKPDYGINAPAVPFDNNLPTYLRITDITEDGYYSKKDIVSVSSQDALKYVMEKGDLVFARTGASTGKTYLYDPKDGMLVFAGFLIRVRTDENVLLPEFFKYQTQTPQYKNWIDANSMRTGQPGINGNEYEAYPVSIPYKNDKPDLPAQRRIAAILSGIDAKIAAEEKVLEKYEKVKKGLMEKLLNEKCEIV